MTQTGGFTDPTQTIEEMTGVASPPPSQEPGQYPGDPTGESAPELAPSLTPPGEEPGGVGEPGAVGGPGQPTLPEGMVSLPDGTAISLERLSELATIDRAFRENPAVASAVQSAVSERGLFSDPVPAPLPPPQAPGGFVQPPAGDPSRQGYAAPSAPAASPVPEDVDPNDPMVRWFIQQSADLSRSQQDLAARQQAFEQQAAAQRGAVAQQAVPRARQRIHEAYPHLTVDDVAQAEAVAVSRGLGTHFASTYGDPERAAYEAIETAATLVPELRTKILQPAPQAGVSSLEAARRQKQLNALSGSGGAAPRSEPPPAQLTNDQKVAAMAEEIARAQNSNT